jgi:hypothetical protein
MEYEDVNLEQQIQRSRSEFLISHSFMGNTFRGEVCGSVFFLETYCIINRRQSQTPAVILFTIGMVKDLNCNSNW